jgi:CTD kinase subunit beta
MLDAKRARDEAAEVDKYHKVEEEEYEVEMPNDKAEEANGDRRRAR